MKLIFSTVLALLLVQGVQAQNFSIGARTGLSHSFDASEACTSDKELSWDKEIFARYQTKGKMAFEFRTGHYRLNSSGLTHDWVDFYNPDYYPVSEKITADRF